MNIHAMAPIPTTTTTTTPNDDAVEAPKNFLCPNPECGKSFGTRAGLRYHQKNANKPGCGPVGGDTLAQKRTSNEGGEFKCTMEGCDKSYTTKAGLRYHITSHHGVPKMTKEQREVEKKKRRKEKRAAKLAEAGGQAASVAAQAQQQVQKIPQQQAQQQQAQQQQVQQQQQQQQQQQAAQMQMQNPHQAYGYSQVRQPTNPALDYYGKAAPKAGGDDLYQSLSAFQNLQQPTEYYGHQMSYAQQPAAQKQHQQTNQYYPQQQTQAQAAQGGNLTQLQHQLQQTLQQTPAYNTGNTGNVGDSAAHLQPLNKFNNYSQYYPQQQAPQMAAANPISSFLTNPASTNGNQAMWTSQLQGNAQAYGNAAGVAQMRQQQTSAAPNAYAPVPQWGSTNPNAYLQQQQPQRK